MLKKFSQRFLQVLVVGSLVLGLTGIAQAQDPSSASAGTVDQGFGVTLQKKDLQGYATDETAVINTIINIVFVAGACIALFYLITGAIAWITSGGETSKIAAARQKITGAVIGLLLLGATFAILQLVLSVLGMNDLNFIKIDPLSGT